MGAAKECPPEDMGPAPAQVAPVGEACEAAFETGGMLLPEITPGAQSGGRKLLDSARLQGAEGEKHVVFPCPSVDPNPVPGPCARGFFRVDFLGYSLEVLGAFSTTALPAKD